MALWSGDHERQLSEKQIKMCHWAFDLVERTMGGVNPTPLFNEDTDVKFTMQMIMTIAVVHAALEACQNIATTIPLISPIPVF